MSVVPLLSSLFVPVNVDGEGRLRLQPLICENTVVFVPLFLHISIKPLGEVVYWLSIRFHPFTNNIQLHILIPLDQEILLRSRPSQVYRWRGTNSILLRVFVDIFPALVLGTYIFSLGGDGISPVKKLYAIWGLF